MENILILGVIAHQTGGKAHEAELLVYAAQPQLVAPDGGQGQEGGAAAVPLLQEIDGALGVFLPVHHDVLKARPQGDLNGQGVLLIRFHEVRHRAVDAPQASLRLHDHLDGLGKALVVLFHLRQQADAVVQGTHFHGQLDFFLTGGGGFFLPLLHPQAVARDDVAHSLRLVPGVFQGTTVGLGLPAAGFQLLLRRGLVRFHSGDALGDLSVFRRDGGGFGALVRGSSHSHGLPAPQGFRLALGAAGLVGGGAGLVKQSLQIPVQLRQLVFQLTGQGLLLLRLPGKPAGAGIALRQLRLGTLNVFPVVGDGALQHRHGRLLVLHAPVHGSGLPADALGLHILFLHPGAELLSLGIQGIQPGLGLIPLGFGDAKIRLQLPGVGLQGIQILQPYGDLQKAQLVPEDQILFRLFRLVPQGLHLQLQLGDLVVDADQILLRPLQLSLRVLFPVAEFGDAGGLLEDLPALAAFGGEDLVDLTLADNGVALLAHAGVHEQLRHILQSDGLAVDVIFALPAAVIAAGDGDLRFLHGGENMLRVVNDQRHLGKSHLGPLGGAAENDILHFGTPKALAALLAHDPADGVGNVGFAGAIGAHDGGDILAKVQDRLIREGFEALDLQCF